MKLVLQLQVWSHSSMYISPVSLLQEGLTALHYAAKSGWLEVVNFLVDSGASVHAECCMGRTPLQYAAEGNQMTTVSFLLQQPNNNIQNLLEDNKVDPNFPHPLGLFSLYLECTFCQ